MAGSIFDRVWSPVFSKKNCTTLENTAIKYFDFGAPFGCAVDLSVAWSEVLRQIDMTRIDDDELLEIFAKYQNEATASIYADELGGKSQDTEAVNYSEEWLSGP